MRSSGFVLFVCGGLLLSGGAILGGSAAWSLMRMSYYFWTTDLGVELGSSIILIAGALLSLPCCWLTTVVPYHAKSASLGATLITLSMAAMLMLSLGVSSMSSLSRALREPAALNASMLRALTHVGFDPTVRSAFSTMQIELKCCGVQSPFDWVQYRSSLPPACCGRVQKSDIQNGKHQRSDQCYISAFAVGCLRPAICELANFANAMTILASALIIVLAVTLFAGAYSMVTEVLEREPRFKPQPLRVACTPPSAPALLPPSFLAPPPSFLAPPPSFLAPPPSFLAPPPSPQSHVTQV